MFTLVPSLTWGALSPTYHLKAGLISASSFRNIFRTQFSFSLCNLLKNNAKFPFLWFHLLYLSCYFCSVYLVQAFRIVQRAVCDNLCPVNWTNLCSRLKCVAVSVPPAGRQRESGAGAAAAAGAQQGNWGSAKGWVDDGCANPTVNPLFTRLCTSSSCRLPACLPACHGHPGLAEI